MAQDQNSGPRSIQEMLESANVSHGPEVKSEVELLKEELAQKEKLIQEQQQAMEGQSLERPEGTPIVSKDQLGRMVETAQGTREAREQIEGVEEQPVIEQSQEEIQQVRASAAQAAAIKKGLADDIAMIQDLNRPKQVKSLVVIALQRGVHYAFDVANGLKDPYLLDEFHDAMANEMKDVLIERKKLKE